MCWKASYMNQGFPLSATVPYTFSREKQIQCFKEENSCEKENCKLAFDWQNVVIKNSVLILRMLLVTLIITTFNK